MEDSGFGVGFILGLVVMFLISIYSLSTNTEVVREVKVPIVPVKKLVTDGVTVDTVYVYTFK